MKMIQTRVDGPTIVGITGTLGAGKSYFRKLLEEFFDDQTIDVDALAIKLLYGEDNIGNIVSLLGDDIFEVDGYTVDKKIVAKRIFPKGCEAAKWEIESMAKTLLDHELNRIFSASKRSVIFLENALLFESGQDSVCDKIICIWCNEETSIKRALDGTHRKSSFKTREDVLERMRSQIPYTEKISVSDFHFSTNSEINPTYMEICVRQIRSHFDMDEQNKVRIRQLKQLATTER